MDVYQSRYKSHQKRKAEQLFKIMERRHSERVFGDGALTEDEIAKIEKYARVVPSSCDRKAVYWKWITKRDDKQILGGLLVGGVGWIHRADRIMLLFADRFAYKENLFYMPFLDGGIIVQQIYLTCTAIGLKCCFVNPNIRIDHYPFFDKLFNSEDHFFLGAMAIGRSDKSNI